jgi:tetratricopeptide (TPR) repeat protein
MTIVLLVAFIGVSSALAEAGQSGRQAPAPAVQPDAVAQAYAQFLLAHRLEDDDDIEGAIVAYKRAMALDPKSSDIVAELADLYLRQNRMPDAIATAEQALKISPTNREAHRVLGTIYASMATSENSRGGRQARQENLDRSIRHLEQAVERPADSRVQADVNLRAMLARLYVIGGKYDQAIPVLSEIVKQEPGWQDGAALLVEAYTSAGRTDDAIRWLEETAPANPQLYSTLADLHARGRRWREAAAAYEQALQASRSVDLRRRYAGMLLNIGGEEEVAKARDVLREAVSIRGNDELALYLLSQAERRAGDLEAAERTARRLIAQNSKNARGYSSLAETLEERRRYQEVVDMLAPAVDTFRAGADSSTALGLLLPHLGFAYQQVGQFDKAVAVLEEARKLSPRDSAITGYLIQAQLAAKNYSAAAELARAARADRPDDLRLARLEAEALRQGGKSDQAVALLEDVVLKQASNPAAHVALARVYSDANRGAQAVKVLQDAQAKFPGETSITFELGAVFEKQKKFADAEAAFRQIIAREPENAAALNYLGYMLAERGERLDESVGLLKRALQIEPENGSYLDSLGWAYYKDGKLDLAEENLKKAADQLLTNSIVQDHYGDVLFKLGRFDEAISAWDRALAGDGDSIDREDIDRKIRSARQKLPRR